MPGTISSMSNSFPVGLESTHDVLPLGKSGILAHTALSSSAPDRIRTCDLRFRRPTLYPTELRAQLAEKEGFEPSVGVYAVSYTHLRAHETKANLVCRLLL